MYRNVIASAGDVTKTFLVADLNERVREMATRWSHTTVRPSLMTSMLSGADADESDENDDDNSDDNDNDNDDDDDNNDDDDDDDDNDNDLCPMRTGGGSTTDQCCPLRARTDDGATATGLGRGMCILWQRRTAT